MKRGWFATCGLLLALILLVAAGPVLDDVGPRGQLEQSVRQILTVLQDDTLQGAPRRVALSSLIRKRFDFQVMSQYVLGPQWRKTSQNDRAEFMRLFSDLLEASYIGKIEAYTDEKVLFGAEQIEERKAQVATQIVTASAEIPIDYRLVNDAGEWLVYDVIVEGVSLVRTYRDTYRELVRKEGMNGLLVRMQEKLEEIRATEASG